MKYKVIFVSIFVVILLLLINFKFAAWPEMLLWPYLNLHGWSFYKDIAIAHTPLMLWFLDIFYKLFGAGIVQLKIFTWLLLLGTGLVVYRVSANLWGKKVALASIAAFFFWMLFFDGNGLWFDLFMGLFTLLSYYFLRKKKYALAGIFWSIAFLSKQTAVFFLLPIALELTQNKKSWVSDFKRFLLGLASTSLLFIMAIWLSGILPSFYYWAIKFGVFILPKAQGQLQFPDLRQLMIAALPFGIFVPLLLGKEKQKWNLLVWAVAGSFGAYPRFEYFHFQPAVPFMAIASGLVFSQIKEYKGFLKIFMILYILGSLYLFANYFMRNWREGTRFYESDVSDITEYVKSNLQKGDRLFVMNWWDNIYALTNTIPAVDPWVPQLSWYQDISGVQEKEVEDLSSAKPKIILLNPYSESGLSAYVPQKVYNYVQANYKLKETIDGIEILIQR